MIENNVPGMIILAVAVTSQGFILSKNKHKQLNEYEESKLLQMIPGIQKASTVFSTSLSTGNPHHPSIHIKGHRFVVSLYNSTFGTVVVFWEVLHPLVVPENKIVRLFASYPRSETLLRTRASPSPLDEVTPVTKGMLRAVLASPEALPASHTYFPERMSMKDEATGLYGPIAREAGALAASETSSAASKTPSLSVSRDESPGAGVGAELDRSDARVSWERRVSGGARKPSTSGRSLEALAHRSLHAMQPLSFTSEAELTRAAWAVENLFKDETASEGRAAGAAMVFSSPTLPPARMDRQQSSASADIASLTPLSRSALFIGGKRRDKTRTKSRAIGRPGSTDSGAGSGRTPIRRAKSQRLIRSISRSQSRPRGAIRLRMNSPFDFGPKGELKEKQPMVSPGGPAGSEPTRTTKTESLVPEEALDTVALNTLSNTSAGAKAVQVSPRDYAGAFVSLSEGSVSDTDPGRIRRVRSHPGGTAVSDTNGTKTTSTPTAVATPAINEELVETIQWLEEVHLSPPTLEGDVPTTDAHTATPLFSPLPTPELVALTPDIGSPLLVPAVGPGVGSIAATTSGFLEGSEFSRTASFRALQAGHEERVRLDGSGTGEGRIRASNGSVARTPGPLGQAVVSTPAGALSNGQNRETAASAPLLFSNGNGRNLYPLTNASAAGTPGDMANGASFAPLPMLPSTSAGSTTERPRSKRSLRQFFKRSTAGRQRRHMFLQHKSASLTASPLSSSVLDSITTTTATTAPDGRPPRLVSRAQSMFSPSGIRLSHVSDAVYTPGTTCTASSSSATATTPTITTTTTTTPLAGVLTPGTAPAASLRTPRGRESSGVLGWQDEPSSQPEPWDVFNPDYVPGEGGLTTAWAADDSTRARLLRLEGITGVLAGAITSVNAVGNARKLLRKGERVGVALGKTAAWPAKTVAAKTKGVGRKARSMALPRLRRKKRTNQVSIGEDVFGASGSSLASIPELEIELDPTLNVVFPAAIPPTTVAPTSSDATLSIPAGLVDAMQPLGVHSTRGAALGSTDRTFSQPEGRGPRTELLEIHDTRGVDMRSNTVSGSSSSTVLDSSTTTQRMQSTHLARQGSTVWNKRVRLSSADEGPTTSSMQHSRKLTQAQPSFLHPERATTTGTTAGGGSLSGTLLPPAGDGILRSQSLAGTGLSAGLISSLSGGLSTSARDARRVGPHSDSDLLSAHGATTGGGRTSALGASEGSRPRSLSITSLWDSTREHGRSRSGSKSGGGTGVGREGSGRREPLAVVPSEEGASIGSGQAYSPDMSLPGISASAVSGVIANAIPTLDEGIVRDQNGGLALEGGPGFVPDEFESERSIELLYESLEHLRSAPITRAHAKSRLVHWPFQLPVPDTSLGAGNATSTSVDTGLLDTLLAPLLGSLFRTIHDIFAELEE